MKQTSSKEKHLTKPQRQNSPIDRHVEVAEAMPAAIGRGQLAASEVLQLQRSIGNRATRDLLMRPVRSTIQRKMLFSSQDLGGTLTTFELVKGFFGQSTYAKIRKTLVDYEAATDPVVEKELLETLDRLGATWLDENGSSLDENDLAKRATIRAMRRDIERELPEVSKLTYTKDIAAGKFKYLSHSGSKAADTSSADFQSAHAKVSAHGISEGELAAIRIYTAQDYKYMNPILADNEGWLDAKTEELTTRGEWSITDKKLDPKKKAELKKESGMHTQMAVSGLDKLPNWTGDGFRGLALMQDEIDTKYAKGSVITFAPFTSTSTKRNISESFARMEAKGGKKAVLLLLKISKGKDVNPISFNPGEGEVLLPPGAKFEIKDDPLVAGDLTVITMTQL